MLHKLITNARKASVKWQKQIVDQLLEWKDSEKVSEAEFERRIAICEKCEKFNTEERRCTICHCFMDIKASLAENPFSFPGAEKKVHCADKQNLKW